MIEEYIPQQIEPKWQKIWEERNSFGLKGVGEKKYILVMFPYPSGRIHMGHVRNYSIGDAIARFYRMKGYDVLHPIGWDAFGLPAENAAIEHGVHPAEWTRNNISHMKEQLKKLGISYDWNREIDTSSPEYYKWEQLFFIKMYEKQLAYRKMGFVNFCQSCETVLANEQVVGGSCWRCGTPITKKKMWGWFLKITKYAEELLDELKNLEWPERVKKMQRDWIGKSKGAKFNFPIAGSNLKLEIFTTRPDTVFGVTFMVLAPEHELVIEITKPENKMEVESFCEKVMRMTKEERGEQMLGVFTGAYAINPFNNEKIPIWVSNYVLPDYGTGAIMAVPAHDSRDFEFARKYNIPIKPVIVPYDREHNFSSAAFEESGKIINSGEFSGMHSEEAKNKITQFAKEKGIGDFAVSYKLRDWGISRQRYWGTPIPIIYCPKCGTVVERNLPVVLPQRMDDMEKWSHTRCPYCNTEAKREKDTMDTFVESSWYFLGYLSGNTSKVDFSTEPFNSKLVERYMPVDMYIGGIEHAVLHLLYARFFTKVLRDLGYIKISEPFKKLITQGMVIKDGSKMSKSKGNVVDPDDVVKKYGADTARCFILFAAPVEKDLEWSDRGVNGIYRFIRRVWKNFSTIFELIKEYDIEISEDKIFQDDISEKVAELRKAYSKSMVSAYKDITELGFNTALARMMEFINHLEEFIQNTQKIQSKNDAECIASIAAGFLKIFSLFAPHVCEELYQNIPKIRKDKMIAEQSLDDYEKLSIFLQEQMIKIPVQINGKLRGEIEIQKDSEQEDVKNIILKSEKFSKYINSKKIKQIIYVKNRIINVIVE